jgi:YjbE family integral membrane protein
LRPIVAVEPKRSMPEQLAHPQFWVAVLQVVWINILLSGDNAVVIAMACRGLPRRQRRWGMIIGAGIAAVLLVGFTAVVSELMLLPYRRLVSAAVLFWIAIKLVGPADAGEDDGPKTTENLWRAVQVVVVADIIMSLDNVVAVAAVANGRYALLASGLAISIPIVVAGSAAILALLERFPIIVWAGGAVLGWVAGQLLVTDPLIATRLDATAAVHIELNSTLTGTAQHAIYQIDADLLEWAAGIVGAAFVPVAGWLWRRGNGKPADEIMPADPKQGTRDDSPG